VAGVERPAVGDRWDTGRTEAFSDGVFAIAITLLVLDISVPESGLDDLWRGIVDQWPSYLAYVTSFLTIGALWLAHHGIFARLRFVDSTVMRLNLLLLMTASFLPFPTRLMAEAILDSSAERAAVIFYGSALMVILLLVAAMWRAVAARRELLRPEVGDQEVDRILRGTAPSLGSYIAVTLVAIIAPHVAAFGYLLIAIMLVVRARGSAQPEGTAHGSASARHA
jgi:uncharacterized membrane protein